MSVTSSRLVNDTEAAQYAIPTDERSEWYRLDLSLENIVYNSGAIPADGVTPGAISSFSSRVTASSPLFNEEGTIKALHFIRAGHDGFRASASNLRPVGSDTTPEFAVGMTFQVSLVGGVGGVYYAYESLATYQHSPSAGFRAVTALERATATTPNRFDTRAWSQDAEPRAPLPTFNDVSSDINLHGQRHLKLFGRAAIPGHPELNPNYDFSGLGVGSTTAGYIDLYSAYDTESIGSVYPFGAEMQTPCSIEVTEDYHYTAAPPQCVGSVAGDALPTTPGIVAVLVRWVRSVLARQSHFQHPNRSVYAAANTAAGVEIHHYLQPGNTYTVLATIPDTRNPSIYMVRTTKNASRKANKGTDGVFELMAKHAPSGTWCYYRSEDGGLNWSFMSQVFESTNIDYAHAISTSDGAVAVAIIKADAGNKAVFKPTRDTANWGPDSAAKTIRDGAPNVPISVAASTDGRRDYAVIIGTEWIDTKDGGNTWP